MRKDNLAIVISTIFISIMILVATIMLIFMGNHFHNGETSVGQNETEASFVVNNRTDVTEYDGILPENTDETMKDIVEDDVRKDVLEDGSYSIGNGVERVSGVFLSDRVNLSLEDIAGHSVSYENSYTNSVPLLPSVNYKHEPISRSKVDTKDFTESFCSDEVYAISVENKKKKQSDTFEIPTEITLYNVKEEKSNSFLIETYIEGNQDFIKSIGWSTSDSSVLALSKTSGKKVKITRKADYVGDMKLSVLVTYVKNAREEVSKKLDIIVHIIDMTDTNTRLFTKDGVALYVDEEGSRFANLSDYGKQTTFYGDAKITGWQTIDGKTYYYNSDGVAIKGDQVISGLKYQFDENGVLVFGAGQRGIDVSLYQKKIDWKQVAASGIDFAIIRCGFRGAATGSLVEDSYFRTNIEGAKAAGLRVGVYFYTQARTEEEAREEAHMALGLCKNYTLDLPIFVDSENMEGGRANDLDQDTRTKALIAFCQTVEAGGREAGVYASKYWFYDNVHAKDLESYTIWVAQYATECDYVGKQNYWQYSSQEQIAGIEGNVDMNIVR